MAFLGAYIPEENQDLSFCDGNFPDRTTPVDRGAKLRLKNVALVVIQAEKVAGKDHLSAMIH